MKSFHEIDLSIASLMSQSVVVEPLVDEAEDIEDNLDIIENESVEDEQREVVEEYEQQQQQNEEGKHVYKE